MRLTPDNPKRSLAGDVTLARRFRVQSPAASTQRVEPVPRVPRLPPANVRLTLTTGRGASEWRHASRHVGAQGSAEAPFWGAPFGLASSFPVVPLRGYKLLPSPGFPRSSFPKRRASDPSQPQRASAGRVRFALFPRPGINRASLRWSPLSGCKLLPQGEAPSPGALRLTPGHRDARQRGA